MDHEHSYDHITDYRSISLDLVRIVFTGISDRDVHDRLPFPRDARVPDLGEHHRLLRSRHLQPVNICSHLGLLSSGPQASEFIIVSLKKLFQSASYPQTWLAESSQAGTQVTGHRSSKSTFDANIISETVHLGPITVC